MSTLLDALGDPGGARATAPRTSRPRPDLVVIGNAVRATTPRRARSLASGHPVRARCPRRSTSCCLAASAPWWSPARTARPRRRASLAAVLLEARARSELLVGGVAANFGGSFRARRRAGVRRRGRRVRHRVLRQGAEVPPLPAGRAAAHRGRVRPRRHLPRPRAREGRVREARRRSPCGGPLVAASGSRSLDEVASATRAAACSATASATAATSRRAGSRPGHDGHALRASRVRGAARAPTRCCRPGRANNVRNALGGRRCARRAASRSRGIVRARLARFRGVKRRQEVRGEAGGVTVIDDFAHHPTAVAGRSPRSRRAIPGRRLVGGLRAALQHEPPRRLPARVRRGLRRGARAWWCRSFRTRRSTAPSAATRAPLGRAPRARPLGARRAGRGAATTSTRSSRTSRRVPRPATSW